MKKIETYKKLNHSKVRNFTILEVLEILIFGHVFF